jgi:integrative and conjugative element protein (TIGR02256 family)
MQRAWIATVALQLIEEDAVKWGVRETGGPLFGYETCGEIVITRAFPPGPEATHLPMLYRPDRGAVQNAIDQVAEASQERERWIGSWHSHPVGLPRPSIVDRHTARKISAEKKVYCPEPVMLIQTTRPKRRGLRAAALGSFRYSPSERDLLDIDLREADLSNRLTTISEKGCIV